MPQAITAQLCLLTKGRLGIPARRQEVSEADPMVLSSQTPVQDGHILPTPREGHHQDPQSGVRPMVPVKT
jgi:hypothetical protein